MQKNPGKTEATLSRDGAPMLDVNRVVAVGVKADVSGEPGDGDTENESRGEMAVEKVTSSDVPLKEDIVTTGEEVLSDATFEEACSEVDGDLINVGSIECINEDNKGN